MEFITLNNGVKMPAEGIGTFLLTPDKAETAVLSALKDGARLIDTANAYCNEKAVGRAMKKSGLLREEIFLETKLWPTFYTDADAVDKTLARLDTDYIDLLLIHQPAGDYVAGYRLMEKAYKEGKVRAIGLSNFNEEKIKELQKKSIKTYAAHLRGENAYDEEDYTTGCAFLIGNEGNGLRDEVADCADCLIRIPMEGEAESLNAAVAAAVLMFEAGRQRRKK